MLNSFHCVHDGQITDSDRTVIGHLDPKGFGGITNTFHYKRLQLSFLLDARFITGSNYLTALYANNPPGSFRYSTTNAPIELVTQVVHPVDKDRKRELLAHNLSLPVGVKPEAAPDKVDHLRLQLPSDADIDRMMAFIERVWRRLVDMVVNAQRDMLRRS